jgi:hypothetical protein
MTSPDNYTQTVRVRFNPPTIKCFCEKPEGVLWNFDRMWGDGEIYCNKCSGFVRYFDSG